MASRRVRIKGIANIPQRRKPTSTTNESKSEEQNDDDNKSEEIADIPNLNHLSSPHDTIPLVDQVKSDINLSQDVSETNTNTKSLKESAKSGSDTEYQQPPASPTKILNRRIKAIPKLHQRRTSFSIGSASESEDDTRRSHSRIRNDSVCSVNSGVVENHSITETKSPGRKEYTIVQRKCRRTEQTRKFAEARREFNMKFVNGKPDKQKLTMIDLIFYNPATNPMSCNKRKRKSTSSSDVSDTRSKPEEEKVDDPQPASESDNELPAPQIKVGPNGEIIVDEKSLIIENTETKKGRQALQMSEVVDGDDDMSYGIYKRIKRTKEWTKEETLRFYRALNTIGTDFTMMCELFPNRTRRELKMKFKKEERLNQSLINKAVMQPCEFDMTELRKDLELEERKAEEKKKRAEEAKAARAAALEQRKNVKWVGKIKGIDVNPEHFPPTATKKPPAPPPAKKQKRTAYDTIKKGINSVFSDSDVDDDLLEDNSHTNDDDENTGQENLSNILKPTRYGRIPKPRLAGSTKSDKQEENKKDDGEHKSDNKQTEFEPGSIMIVKSKTSNDELVYKVYIVTDNKTKQQIDLSPNVLKNLDEMSGNRIDSEEKNDGIQAHNILTISAQEFSELDHLNLVGNSNTETESINSKDNALKDPNINIVGDRIVIPFDECLTPTSGNQNITVSH
ncbi:rna polymerase iii transcription initiation factor b [Holotrichia oblita]|uniref:Rna polymerase iii transcription initiation factor b n=1 Tax=Holotrichia oblita TaxID=644536 RepID=A0ACB9TLJ7_HOLOL|nr:rna polymerase iii transcription initiation factor b [Holotrichia oblita]